ncbi:MAG: flavodoxin, partial [Lachnospiraceae bacterium]|nr:flavodoxin [Lachnospiraceae bacterium]
MKKIISLLLCGLLVLSFTACGGNAGPGSSNNDAVDAPDTSSEGETDGESDTLTDRTQYDDPVESSETSEEQVAESTDVGTPAGSNILVAYFSLADEQYEVGVIEKGNTQIIAEMIAEQTGADTFSIERAVAYPTTYDGLLEISREEESNPPEIAGTVGNMDDYSVIFIGYPIWWGDLPTIVTVFLESYDFTGKTVIPFCTHAGSGLCGTQGTVEKLCEG